ncbi:MAG: protein phosphatase 2C domain-containing protein [Spirochaetales bacterium]
MQVDRYTATKKAEDRFFENRPAEGVQVLSVIDGHGGSRAAELIVQTLTAFCAAAGEEKDRWFRSPEQLVGRAVEEAAVVTQEEWSGAVMTLVVVLEYESWLDLIWAQLGDTLAIWRNIDGEIERTPDHNCRSNPEERDAAVARGGVYRSGYIMSPDGIGGLQPSRSLGDAYMGPITSKLPDIGRAKTPGPVLLSTDGVVAGLGNMPEAEREVFDALYERVEAGDSLDLAVPAACRQGVMDDVTVLSLRRFPAD